MVNRDNKVDNPLQSLDVLVLLRHYNIAVVDADQYYNPCDLFGSVHLGQNVPTTASQVRYRSKDTVRCVLT